MFARLTRHEGKGFLLVNAAHAVLIFDARGKTVIRTTATGENINFVVEDSVEDLVKRLTSLKLRFIRVTRRKDSRPLFFNVDHIIGIYERTGATTIRTAAAGENAEYPVIETLDEIEALIAKA